MDFKDLEKRFSFHPAKDSETKERHEQIRAGCLEMAQLINILVSEGPEKSLAVTKLEEVMMWANAGIARNN